MLELVLACALMTVLPDAPPAFTDAAIDRAVRELPLKDNRIGSAATGETRFVEGKLFHEVTVSAWNNEQLLAPDYSRVTRTAQLFGVPRGGSSGSPGFDTVTRTYWWE